MPVTYVTAAEVKKLMDGGALLVDIREPNEHRGENIPTARNVPLSQIAGASISGAPAVVFHCKSGARTKLNAQALAASTGADAYILDGGIDAWKAAGFPVNRG